MTRPLCKQCKERGCEKAYGRGRVKWRSKCYACRRPMITRISVHQRRRNRDLEAGTLSRCSRCGFKPEDVCQMDIDHINGNHNDNRPENRQVLCANCHRLKTRTNGEGIYAFHKKAS